ncbi:HYR domain-containing protein [Marinoscillum furvescens]|uniref:HYR domain-containing protein n=1 Tax=Marinoscillum furvescens DSM 4134 TaxID=1122208 RepID=A0A3D9L1I5_MARFU|nr:HYR domain-containing protein [Marinoscillum furvescens]RED95946.1 HYR domain-containing protein [Marinoscillum furvescens DSM 4134]
MNRLRNISLLATILFTMTCTACKDDGNMPEKEQEITDEISPEISCPEDIMLSIGALDEEPTVDYNTPVGTDNNEGAITKQTAGLASGEIFPEGTTTNTFVVTDASGNTSSCSFDVTVTREATDDVTKPYVYGNIAPEGKKWVLVENLSDEFDGPELDGSKWHNDPATDPFGWYGRPPALFDPENVAVADGNLRVTVLEYDQPKTAKGKSWTHGGAILRSREKAVPGQFYECRMQANATVMSSTFWIAFTQNCNNGPKRKLELDIQECVGRVHEGTHSWAQKWDATYHSNTWRHARSCDVAESESAPKKKDLEEKNHSRFFVYGCWWKSPTEILFYLDGEYVYTITPPTDFDLEGHITMAIETYDWNPIDENNILKTGSEDKRTTKYDWVRTWKLVDE